LYFLVLYLKEHRLIHLLASLFTFAFIVFLLHRTVISTAVVAAGMVIGIAGMGRLTTTTTGLPIGRTLTLFIVLLTLMAPLAGLLPESKLNSFMESIGGILAPEEDNTGSWRVEQSTYYLSQVPERPLLGWRYDGYDRGEIMENEDFPQRGTIIHSQYVDMLFNYGAVGLALNLLLILGTLVVMYSRNPTFSTEQLVLFGFAVGGLIYAVSYQLPVGFWGFLGLGMYYGLKRPSDTESDNYLHDQAQPDAFSPSATLTEHPIRL
jgi:O-antigen ligase